MERPRLAELLAGLSLVADLGMGLEPARPGGPRWWRSSSPTRPVRRSRATSTTRRCCSTSAAPRYAHEAAALLGGDEIAVKRAARAHRLRRPARRLRGYLPHLAPAAGRPTRLRVGGNRGGARRARSSQGYSRANCEVAARTAERRRPGPRRRGRADRHLRAVGRPRRSAPAARRGDRAARADRPGRGRRPRCSTAWAASDAASTRVRRRAGAALDPRLVERSCAARRRASWRCSAVADPVEAAVGAEPEPRACGIPQPGLDRVCRAFGEAVDLKTPLHHGHATGVAAARRRGGPALPGWARRRSPRLRRAALVHDLGRAAVPNGIWERAGPLSWADQERVRLHAYHSERVLARCGPLAPLAPLAGHAPRAARRLGLSPPGGGAARSPLAGARARRGGRLPGDDPGARPPAGALGRPRPRRVLAGGGARRAGSTPTRSRAVRRGGGRAPGRAAPRAARRADRAPGRGAAARRARACRTRRSPSGSSSRRARRSTTCRTSTPASACPAAPPRRCSRWSTTCSPDKTGRSTDARRRAPGGSFLAPTDPRRRSTMEPKDVVRRFVDEYQTGADERAFDELLASRRRRPQPAAGDRARRDGRAPAVRRLPGRVLRLPRDDPRPGRRRATRS